MGTFLKVVVFVFLGCNAVAQPVIQWQKCLGGTAFDKTSSIKQTSDGGYIIAGNSTSSDGDISGHHGVSSNYDCWIVKVDSNGAIEWEKSLGGSYNELAGEIQQTKEGGYIIAAGTNSADGDVSGQHGPFSYYDFWIVKLDSNGIIEWQKCLGGTGDDLAYSVKQTFDDGYIVAGRNNSFDGDVTGNHNSSDYWIVKLDNAGTLIWQKSLGGFDAEEANDIHQTSDSGYIISGYSHSNDSDVSGNHGAADYWVVKTDTLGNIEWQKCFGGSSFDISRSLILTSNKGYIIAGNAESNDGNVSGHHGLNYKGDYWLVKLDSLGNIDWEKSYGGNESEYAYSIAKSENEGFIVTGFTVSNDIDVSGLHGFLDDIWVVKLDSLGTIEWQKCLGGFDIEEGSSIQQTHDGGIIVAGSACSNSGDVTGNHNSGIWDYWIVKLAPLSLSSPEIQNTFMDLKVFQSNDQLNIKFFSKKSAKAVLNIYDVNGKIVFSKNHSVNEGFNYEKVETRKFSAGMYFIKIESNLGALNNKVYIQK